MTPARYLLLLLLTALFAVLGVAQQARAVHLGYRAGRLEAKRNLLAENRHQLLCEVSSLSRPARIAGEVEHLKIALVDPVELTRNSGSDGAGERLQSTRAPRR